MAQWVNRLRNNIFVNQPGLTAGCQAGRLAGRRNTDEFRNFQSWL